jgi:hypothetical protein
MTDWRRVFSAAVRTAYANAHDEDGKPLKQKALRDLVKARFAGGVVDAWLLHCATLEGMDLRKARPDGKMVFGSRATFLRRSKGLIGPNEWREARLRPLCSRGDKLYAGNRLFRLSSDARVCTLRVYDKTVTLHLADMTGNAGEILRQAAALATEKRINVTFRIDSERLHVTVDPMDLPRHPERRRPVKIVPGRAVGVDLNPGWIGLAAVENLHDPARLDETRLMDHALVRLGFARDVSKETVRETLAAVCDRAVALARRIGAGVIAVEAGLGKLRSSGKNRGLNHLLNFWARMVFVAMLRRKAGLAGVRVLEVWGGYSTTIGNIAFEAPDAAASAAEIARRGVDQGSKDVLPILDGAWLAGRRKDLPLRVESRTWADVHRTVKAAKTIGYRRPHPQVGSEGPGAPPPGLAVRRLRHRRRPGFLFRAAAVTQTAKQPETGSRNGRAKRRSTRKTG